MTSAISADAIADAIRAFYAANPDTFVENIRQAKATMTWEFFAGKILDFYTQHFAR